MAAGSCPGTQQEIYQGRGTQFPDQDDRCEAIVAEAAFELSWRMSGHAEEPGRTSGRDGYLRDRGTQSYRH